MTEVHHHPHAEAMGAPPGLDHCPFMPTYGAPAGAVRPGRGQPAVGPRRQASTSTSSSGLAVYGARPLPPRGRRRACAEQARTLRARLEPVRHRARAARSPSPSTASSAAAARCSSRNSGAEANECAIKLARKCGRPRAATSGRQRLRVVPRPHPRHAARHRPARRSTRPSSRCPRASATCAWNDLDALEAAIDPSVAAVLLEPVQGEGGVNPATAEYFAGRPARCATSGACCSWSTRSRPASAAPASGSASSTSASSPTSSPWPRRSATACPSGRAGPGATSPRPSSPATTPPPSAASPWPRRPPGPCSR